MVYIKVTITMHFGFTVALSPASSVQNNYLSRWDYILLLSFWVKKTQGGTNDGIGPTWHRY